MPALDSGRLVFLSQIDNHDDGEKRLRNSLSKFRKIRTRTRDVPRLRNVPTVFVDRRITIGSRECGGHEGYFLGLPHEFRLSLAGATSSPCPLSSFEGGSGPGLAGFRSPAFWCECSSVFRRITVNRFKNAKTAWRRSRLQ